MMYCHDVDDQLPGYLAGTLSEIAALELEAHAAECARCATLVEERTRIPLRLAVDVAPPAHVRTATLSRVGRQRRIQGLRRWVPVAVAATVVLALALGRPQSKSAMMRARETHSPLAMAESRAFEEFQRLAAARAELTGALTSATPDDRLRLEEALHRIDQQYQRLVTLVQEFEI